MKRRNSNKKPGSRIGDQGVPYVKVRRAPGTPTKTQLKAAAAAELRATRLRWRNQLGAARSNWDRLHPQDLARVDGNVHALAGLVQMRYQISRQEADAQVKAFFESHGPAPLPGASAPATAVPAAAAA